MSMLKLKALLAAMLLTSMAPAFADDFITLASTTSTRDSGLLDYIVPIFEKQSGAHVRVIALGTGQALRMARNGDVDVLMVHHRASEDAFVEAGFGVGRRDVMYNDFVIVGPKDDPAHIQGKGDAIGALRKIAAAKATFLSRGDDSGTHKKEQELWRQAGIDIEAASGGWYRETGSGMGATLNAAAATNGYALCDRSTWLAFNNKSELKILHQGDPIIRNPYGVILVNPARHPHVKAADGWTFINWLTSGEGQQAIGDFRINGVQLFVPNAR